MGDGSTDIRIFCEMTPTSDIRSAGCAAIRIRKRCPNGQHESRTKSRRT
jgi:hypothetical protein